MQIQKQSMLIEAYETGTAMKQTQKGKLRLRGFQARGKVGKPCGRSEGGMVW